MKKTDLTPEGVQEIVDALYALPDTQLQDEADALADDFKGWLRSHFHLQPHQETFIETKMSAAFVDYVSVRIPFVFMHRLPIALTVPSEATTKPRDKKGKIIKSRDNTSQATGAPDAEDDADGHFEFEVIYADVDA